MNTMSSNDFKQPIKKKEINEDNFNPFTPYGKMKRSSFLKACIILNVVFVAIVLIADNMQKQFNISDNVINTNIALLFISYFVFNVFVVKKRLYDMTLKSILSWVLSVVLLLFGTTVAITYSTGYSILQLLAIVLLFAKSKKTSEDQEVANKKETFIFKNSLKKIYNYILTNKKK